MRDFIEHLQESFINEVGGNTYDNAYSNLDLTARSLLGFHTPSGSRVTLSSFVRPKFATSYSIGIKDGWISYLYSSHPLSANTVSSSDKIPLKQLLRCYRSLSTDAIRHQVGHKLVYGRLYLPQSRLEALLAARVAPQMHITLRAVSQQGINKHGGTLLGLASWDDPAGRFGIDTVASSDGGVLGLRALWNVTNPTSVTDTTASSFSELAATTAAAAAATPGTSSTTTTAASTTDTTHDKERINGRLSAGGEVYYGLLNKSGGFSLGTRFQTLPTHHGTPLTATLTFNLLGHMSATYAVVAGDCTLASQFGFNVYSYESDWAVGMELWNKRRPRTAVGTTPLVDDSPLPTDAPPMEIAVMGGEDAGTSHMSEKVEVVASPDVPLPVKKTRERSFQAKLEWRLDEESVDEEASAEDVISRKAREDPPGVLKCRCDQRMRIGLLYEGRYKSLLFSLGTDVDLKKLDAPFRTVGLAVQFSS